MDQELRIKIRVDKQTGELSTIGAEFDKLNDSTKKVNTSTNALSTAFMSFKGVVGALGLGFLIKESIQMADTYKLMEGRLNLVSKSASQLATSQTELFKISQNTRQGYADTVDLYTRIARSTEALNKSQSDTLQVTEAINKSFIVSSASAQSASAAVMQLGQGFASGTLRGEELNSILEQAPRLAEAIAKGMNITVGELRKFGEEGKLSAERVFEAIKNQSSSIGDEFGKMPKTFGQAMTQMGNSSINLIGYLDKTTNATSALSNAISSVSKSVDDFTRGLKLSDMPTTNLDILNEKLNRLGSEWSELESRKNLSIFSWDWLPEDAIVKKQKEIEGLISLLVTGKEGLYKLADDERLLKSEILPDRFSRSYEMTKEQLEERYKRDEDAYKKRTELTKKSIEETRKFNDEQFAILAQNSEKSFKQVDAVKEWAKEEEESAKNAINSMQSMQDAMVSYYDAIGDSQNSYYMKEAKLIDELKVAKLLTDTQINEITAKNREKFRDEQFEKENKWLYDYFDNINKALDNSLLDGFKTKFSNFGDWLENLFGSIGDSIFASLSRSFAGSITSSLQTSIVGAMQGGNYARGVATLASGATLSNASEADSTLGGLSALSSLKTAYDVLSGGISGTLLNGFNSVAGLTGVGSIAEFGAGFANPFAYAGMQGLPSAMTYGSLASAGLLGGGIGYGVGSLGDKLLGANSYAGVGGALGGATGGVLASLGVVGGPLGIIAGSLIGSALGGIFGKKTETDRGYNFLSDAYSNNIDVMGYSDWKKKGWFSSSEGSTPFALEASKIKEIEAVFTTYDYLLTQLGDSDRIFLSAGKYSQETYQEALTKNFITAFTDIPQKVLQEVATTTQNQVYDWWDGYYEDITTTTQELVSNARFDEIYQAWVDYAQSVDKTVSQAFSESITAFISSKRTFEIWSLGDSIEALSKKAEFAQEDFSNLSSMMDVNGITVENYLEKYNQAIKESFTAETIAQWDSLGDALMSATDAQTAYQEALIRANEAIRQETLSSIASELTAWVSALGAIQGALDTLSPTLKTFDELKSSSLTLENYSILLGQLEATRQNEMTSLNSMYQTRITQLNNEKTLFMSLSDYIDELNLKLMGSSALTSDYFFNELDRAKATFASGGIVDTSKLTQSASTYLDSALQNSSSQLEYFREVAKVRDSLGEFASMVTGGSLEGIEAAIKTEEATLAFKLDLLNQTALSILASWKGTATTNIVTTTDKYNAINNDIVSKAYSEVLGRTADSDGYAYWTGLVQSGALSESDLKSAIATAAINYDVSKPNTSSVSDATIKQSIENAEKWINGSHATGLDYVPFDGYIAKVHEGERIQTEKEARRDDVSIVLTQKIEDLTKVLISQKAQDVRLRQLFERLAPDGDALQTRNIA